MKLRIATFLVCLCTTLSARAEGNRFGFDLAFHTQQDIAALGLLLEGDFQIAEHIALAAQLPFAVGSVDISLFGGNSSPVQFAVGNPSLALLYRAQSDQTLSYSVGGGLTLPLVGNPDPGTPDEFADAIADAVLRSTVAGTYGMRNVWLWTLDYFTLFAPLAVEYRSAGHLLVLADATLALMLPIRDRARDVSGDPEVAVQLRGGLGSYNDSLEGGVALGLVALPTQDGDVTQIALEPFARIKFSGGHFDARLVINLDEPLGFAFDDGRIWGLHLGVGVLF